MVDGPFGPSPFDGQSPESIVAHLSQAIENIPPEQVQQVYDAATAALAAQKAAPTAALQSVLGIVLKALPLAGL